jgi:hypothetical protein
MARRGARGGDGDRFRPSSTLPVAFSPVTHRHPSSFLPSSLPDARVLAQILFCLVLLALDRAKIREIVGGGSKPWPWLQFFEAMPSCAKKLERAED